MGEDMEEEKQLEGTRTGGLEHEVQRCKSERSSCAKVGYESIEYGVLSIGRDNVSGGGGIYSVIDSVIRHRFSHPFLRMLCRDAVPTLPETTRTAHGAVPTSNPTEASGRRCGRRPGYRQG